MKRFAALLATVAAGGACNPVTWDFGGSGGPDATVVGDELSEAASVDAGNPDGEEEVGLPARCNLEEDCARAGLHCLQSDAAPGQCVQCVSSTDCVDPALPRCDPFLDRCVGCEVDTNCRQGEVCIKDPIYTCVPSCSGRTCPPRAAYCDPTRNICLGCRDAGECELGQVCDPVSGQCVECASDQDCHGKLFIRCDRTTSRCVECLRNSDCGRGVCAALGGRLGVCFDPMGPRGDQ